MTNFNYMTNAGAKRFEKGQRLNKMMIFERTVREKKIAKWFARIEVVFSVTTVEEACGSSVTEIKDDKTKGLFGKIV